MTIEEAIKKIKEQQNEFNEHWIDYAGINEAYKMAIRSIEAWEEVKQDLYKFASDSFDAECAECYRIALRCVEGHLKEVENED